MTAKRPAHTMDTPLRTERDRLAANLRRLLESVEQENAVLPDYLSRPFAIPAERVRAWLDDDRGLQGEHELRGMIERVTRYGKLIPQMLAEHNEVQQRR